MRKNEGYWNHWPYGADSDVEGDPPTREGYALYIVIDGYEDCTTSDEMDERHNIPGAFLCPGRCHIAQPSFHNGDGRQLPERYRKGDSWK